MKNYRQEIAKRASATKTASLKGYKVIDMEHGDKVLGTIVSDGTIIHEVKTPLGLKELDLSKYEHAIDRDLKIVELTQKYPN